jgi:probable rRNA maturation factor
MGVLIKNSQDGILIQMEKIQKKAQAILNALGSPDSELSVMIVDDHRISELNIQYLNHEGPTNVIAFPMQEGDYSEINPNLVGDVVISADTAEKESEQALIDTHERIDQLLVHGILHLFGYDHENTEIEALEMEQKAVKLMGLIKHIESGG